MRTDTWCCVSLRAILRAPITVAAHTTMTYTLKQAAESVGKSKTAILRAVQAGKVSARRDDHGQWLIEPAELHRVYDPVAFGGAPGQLNEVRTGADTGADTTQEIIALETEVRMLREMLADQRTMNEGLENVITDLMARLDRESEDRRRAYAQLTGLITKQSRPAEKKTWWRW